MNTCLCDFGAASDGKTLCTHALQSAIDACASTGGGRVTVPAGKYKIGTVNGNLHAFVYRVDSAADKMYGWCHGRSELRNIEMQYADKSTDLFEKEYAYRGSNLLLFSGASGVTLENFRIHGGLYGVEESVCIEGCADFEKHRCNF